MAVTFCDMSRNVTLGNLPRVRDHAREFSPLLGYTKPLSRVWAFMAQNPYQLASRLLDLARLDLARLELSAAIGPAPCGAPRSTSTQRVGSHADRAA